MKKEMRITDGVSREDILGVLRTYDTLFDFLGFAIRLEPDEFMTRDRGYVCVVTAHSADNPTGRLLWHGFGATQQAAREYMLRLAHSECGMPLAFSEAEAKMRIALVGEDEFRPACRKIEMFAKFEMFVGEFERK